MFSRITSPKERLNSQDTKKFLWIALSSVLLYGIVFLSFLQVGTALVQSLVTGLKFDVFEHIGCIALIAIYFFGRFAYSAGENIAKLDDLVYLQELIERQSEKIDELEKALNSRNGDEKGDDA